MSDIKVIGLYDENGHLKNDILLKMKSGELNGDALISALDHIAECPDCALSYSLLFEESELSKPPRGFDEELERKLAAKRPSSDKKDFTFYVIKVAVAASIAIVMTFAGSFGTAPNYTQKFEKANSASTSFINNISEKLNSFSHNFVNLEVFKNAAKKK
jgi:hypothetical protein